MFGATNLTGGVLVLGTVFALAAVASAALNRALWPWLRRFALAQPNARSAHREPTPQGGGIAVVAVVLALAWAAAAILPSLVEGHAGALAAVTAATILLALVGFADDVRVLPALPRLILQCIAAGIVLAVLPGEAQLLPIVPWWLERALLFIGLVWFVNAVNFMDGIDWMMVVEVVPIAGAIALLGTLGLLHPFTTVLSTALLGAMLGFAPFNRPVAKLFLGDVGSLPVGLLLGSMLLELAVGGHLAAAFILPLYFVADATITLFRRLLAGERIWESHRSHFYQRALDRGMSVSEVVQRVFLVNVVLAALALISVAETGMTIALLLVAVAIALVAWLLHSLVSPAR